MWCQWPEFVTPISGESSTVENKIRALLGALAEFIQSKTGVPVLPDIWEKTIPPPHLQMNYKVVDDAGRDLAMSRDLSQLKHSLVRRRN